jgi:hypothetical protein
MMVAFAIPPPSHMVCKPYRFPCCSRALTSVVMMRAPLAPSGWPIAMAPPLRPRRRAALAYLLTHIRRSLGRAASSPK